LIVQRNLCSKKKIRNSLYYGFLEEEVSKMNQMLADLQQRDDNLYRIIFETEPVPTEIRKAGIGGSDRYREIKEKGLNQEEMIISLHSKIDALKDNCMYNPSVMMR
jgi:hypothetical protein